VGVAALVALARPAITQTVTDQGPSKADVAFFDNEVLPVLKANCYKCHGEDKTRGGLSLGSRPAILKGGESGPAVDLKSPEDSLLVKAINHRDGLAMPPSPAPKLQAKEIDILTRWVKSGLPGINDKAVVAEAKKGAGISAEARKYWAYQPVQRPQVPPVKNKGWVKNPIDSFVLAKLEAKGLEPAAPADRRTLIRRVYYDLIGLPPTPEEVDAFVNDTTPDSYERLLDKLMASPHYGEKWARHWLDLVRFAETNGFEFDQDKPFIWRYRDYVIDAFNKDKPYDQFVHEQIAGDMLSKTSAETMIATGYYRLGQWDSGAADRLVQKYATLDSILSTTGQVFMGISIGCARCHDHKADPILQRDYYQLLAFFHNVSDFGAKSTKRMMAPAEGKEQERLLREKQEREVGLARQLHEMEERFAGVMSDKKLVKAGALPVSDIMDLSYRFYRDTWERLPEFDALQPEGEGELEYNYITLSPASREESMGFVFEGTLKVLKDGEYTFYLEATEGARLLIEGRRVLDRPNKDEHTTTAKARLSSGLLPFRLEYFNSTAKPRLKLEWSGPELARRFLTVDPGQEIINLDGLIRDHGEKVLETKDVEAYTKLVSDFDQTIKSPLPQVGIQVSSIVESGSAPTHILIRGNPTVKGDRVEAAFPEVLLPGKQTAVTGGRLALAKWLTDPQNPLPARVMVNRLWQHHFGRGIVPSPNDFGKFGEPPTHPELLDWLASEFVASGWKIKQMHRLLMTSNTYKMSSKGNDKALAVDPSNVYFWRYNMRRLAAEEVRDSVLMVSGTLNFKMAGPSIYPKLPKEVLASQARPGQGWKTSPPSEAARRSIYVFTKRSLLVPVLAQFDQADTDASCPVRFTTTVPTQALGLLNDQFSNEQAKEFAARLTKEAPGNLAAQIGRAIRLTTGRMPTADEVRKDIEFIQQLRREHNYDEMEGLRLYCLLILNTNEFVYLD
jgi:hypothetical protein